jgi:hypothetical protein
VRLRRRLHGRNPEAAERDRPAKTSRSRERNWHCPPSYRGRRQEQTPPHRHSRSEEGGHRREQSRRKPIRIVGNTVGVDHLSRKDRQTKVLWSGAVHQLRPSTRPSGQRYPRGCRRTASGVGWPATTSRALLERHRPQRLLRLAVFGPARSAVAKGAENRGTARSPRARPRSRQSAATRPSP